MHFSKFAVAIAALITYASANLLSRQATLPDCAVQCTLTADFGGCQPTDNACLCRSATFLNSSTACIGQQCKGSDLSAAINASKELCALVGVTLTSTPAGFPTGSATEVATSSNSPTSSSSPPPASTSSSSPPASTTNAASINGLNTMAGLAALGLAALAL